MKHSKIPDELSQKLGVLTRRETEARIVAPLVDALASEFGRERVLTVVADTIVRLAREQGSELAERYGSDVEAFLKVLDIWNQGDALEIDMIESSETRLDFNVTRCKFAELYQDLGIADLGAVLSCNRDFSLIEGFNTKARLERKHTIMAGAPCCTFRYSFPGGPAKNNMPAGPSPDTAS